jgi:hypothetical protein
MEAKPLLFSNTKKFYSSKTTTFLKHLSFTDAEPLLSSTTAILLTQKTILRKGAHQGVAPHGEQLFIH